MVQGGLFLWLLVIDLPVFIQAAAGLLHPPGWSVHSGRADVQTPCASLQTQCQSAENRPCGTCL